MQIYKDSAAQNYNSVVATVMGRVERGREGGGGERERGRDRGG
jgi:hypothetical protein